MEEVASICRNIFELVLTVKYYETTEDDAHAFLLQADVDKILIHEGILEWLRVTDPNSPMIRNLNHLTTSKQQGVKPPPRPTVRQMAEKVNMTVEYDGFYKFYSKYIHPSAWIINKPIEELESPGYREILVMQSFIYATKNTELLGAITA